MPISGNGYRERMPDLTVPTGVLVDSDAAGKLLRRIEAHRDMTGWHDEGELWVYVVYDHHDVTLNHHIRRVMIRMGDPIRNSRYTAQPMLPRMFDVVRREEDRAPTDTLRRFAMNLAFADPDDAGPDMADKFETFRYLLAQPGILGFAASYEAHGLKAGLLPRLLPRPGHLHGEPDARELRIAVMVDANDVAHRVIRWRGEPAELTTGDMHGNATTSLRILMDTAAGRLPEKTAQAFWQRYPSAGLHVDMA